MRGTVLRKDIRHGASAVEDADSSLLHAVLELQSRFIAEHDSSRAFIETIARLLELTESEYGFISELKHNEDGTPWLRSLATTDIAWSDVTRDFFASHVQSGLEFRNLDNLFGEVVKTGQVVISNDRENDPRSTGIPENHPPMKSFLGIPFRFNGELVGMLGIANRKSGYSEDLVKWLKPLTDACSTMVAAVHANRELSRSQQLVERIAEASPHILYVFDIVEQRNIYANRQIAKDLGYSSEEIQEMGSEFFARTLHPDDLTKVQARLASGEMAQDGVVLEQEYRMKAANGEWRWFLDRETIFQRDNDGRVRQIVGTAQDITDKVNARQKLEESEARLRAIIETEPECVKLVARDGTLLEMNSAGLAITGADALEDVIGKCVFDLIAPEYLDDFWAFHERVCDGQASTLEMEIIGLKGARRRMETHAVPLKFGSDGEIGHLAITRDVTDVRRAEELIAEHQAQLLHVSRLSSLGQMAAAISHEITQPLSAISNYAAASRILLKRDNPDLETFSRHIGTIAAQTQRAGETLDRIRTFIRGGNSPRQSCDISEVIAGALDLMKAELRNRQVRVEFRSPEALPAVMADRIQIQQIITNLVTNACDAMQQLSENERAVAIICQHDSDHIVISVEDTGPGLNDLSQETLFEAFSTSKSKGMGLGLAICRDIVTAHGGTIVAANARTRGAVFQFTLPVSREA